MPLLILRSFQILRVSGHELPIGSESHKQSWVELGKTLSEGQEPPLPQDTSKPVYTKGMSTGIQPSLNANLAAFTARLDDLRADQNPDDLSNILRAAFKERELYNTYITSLVGDTKRTKALLEVFDKVRSVMDTVSWVGSEPDWVI